MRCVVHIEIFIYLYKFNEVLKGQGSGAACRQEIYHDENHQLCQTVSRNRFHCFSTPQTEKKRADNAHTHVAQPRYCDV